MYEIYAGSQLIHSDITPLESCKALEPKLTLEDNNAGSLEFTLPPVNVGYNTIQKLTTDIVVKEDDVEIFWGRCISETTNFWKNKRYMIEGELAFLNDSIQPPHEYLVDDGTTIRTFLESLIANHNSQVAANRRFTVGMVTVEDGDAQSDDDAIHRYTNYESTLECINEKLVSRLKGHLRVRHYNGVRYLDYLKDYIDAHNKEIMFGVNLLDFTKGYNVTDIVTAIVPRGARLDDSPIEKLEAYTTVASAPADGSWHAANSIFVTNQSAINTLGFICGVVDWDDVTDPSNLLTKAKKYLQAVQFDKMALEVSVVDLHYLNPNIASFKLLEEVRCVSDPHGMDTFFPVTKMEIDLANPANTKFTLGTEVSTSLTATTSKISSSIYDYVNNTPGESAILKSAKDNATNIVIGSTYGGFASFIYGWDGNNAIIDPPQAPSAYTRPVGFRVGNAVQDASATRRWIWTSGGLMHQTKNTSVNPPRWNSANVALTMDGSIVADRMTVGRIRLAGNANVSTWDPQSSNAFLQVYNGSTQVGRWGADGIWIGKGSLTIGSMRSITNPMGNPKSHGFYEYNGSRYVKTNDTSVVSGKTYYAYTSQIDENGASVFSNVWVQGDIWGSNIQGSTFKTVATANKQVYIHEDKIEVYNTTNQSSGYIRCFQGSFNGNFYDYEFGIASSMCHAAWNNGGTYMDVEPRYIIQSAKYFEEEEREIKSLINYWRDHGPWD